VILIEIIQCIYLIIYHDKNKACIRNLVIYSTANSSDVSERSRSNSLGTMHGDSLMYASGGVSHSHVLCIYRSYFAKIRLPQNFRVELNLQNQIKFLKSHFLDDD
jgi:hypothetical protein